MHRKLWADAPFGGIEGRFCWCGLGRRSPDGRQCDDGDRRGRVGSRVLAWGECVGGFGGGAPRNVGADGWSDVHDRTVRMDRACRCDALPPGALGDVAARYGDATSDCRGATTGACEV